MSPAAAAPVTAPSTATSAQKRAEYPATIPRPVTLGCSMAPRPDGTRCRSNGWGYRNRSLGRRTRTRR